jgi:hypothetical protein
MQRWLGATSLSKETNSEGNTTGTERAGGDHDNKSRLNAWIDFHSFYALMRGFAFGTRDLPPEQKFLPGNRDMVILQLDRIEFLAEHEPSLIPDLPKEEILEKRKASGLDKTIICTQATWFLTQLIARLGQRLPISLLELSTAANALCGLLIYVLWWDKPLDIEQLTLMIGERMHVICAALCHLSNLDGHSDSVHMVLLPPEHVLERPPTTLLPHVQRIKSLPLERENNFDKVHKLYDRQCIGRFSTCLEALARVLHTRDGHLSSVHT